MELIRIEKYTQNFKLYMPDMYNNMMEDFTGRLISYNKIYNRRKKRYISVIDKKYWVQRKLKTSRMYIFNIELLKDVLFFLKFQGVELLNPEMFKIESKEKTFEKVKLKLQDKYILKDIQEKYVDAIINNDMTKALIELQTGSGKEMSNHVPVRIPDGWTKIGDLKVGDKVITKDGSITNVIGVYPQGEKEIFKITFGDGRSTECGAEHLWNVYYLDIVKTINTDKIIALLENKIDCYIDLIDSEKNEDKCLDGISAYDIGKVLAYYLGVTNTLEINYDAREEMLKDNIKYGENYSNLKKKFQDVYFTTRRKDLTAEAREEANFRILNKYLNLSTNQRRALLAGIINMLECNGEILIEKKKPEFIQFFKQLVWSLGGIFEDVFIIYKASRYAQFRITFKETKLKILSIESIGFKEATCIAVDHPSKLYVVENYIVTHNTIIGMATTAKKSNKIMVLLPGYIEKWKGDVLNTLDIEPSLVYTIQGEKSINKLINHYQEHKSLDYHVYIVSLPTLMSYINEYEETKKGIAPEVFLDMLGCGSVLIDEAHERFYSIFMAMLYMNPELMIAMTATFTSSSEYVIKFQEVMFPKILRLNFVPIRKYINTVAIAYQLVSPGIAKFKNGSMYSHDVYENQTIIKYKSVLSNYVDMLEYYMGTEYLGEEYKKGDKLIIYVASIRLATMLSEYLAYKYKQLDIRRYVGDDPYDNVIEPDVRVTTLGSAGAAIDMPGLKYVFNTVPTLSPIRNKQSHGRLREIEDEEVKYIYFYCRDLDKHKSFDATRRVHLAPYSKTYRNELYSKKI